MLVIIFFISISGYTVPESIERLDWGGRQLDEYLAKLLRGRGYSFTTAGNIKVVLSRDYQGTFS